MKSFLISIITFLCCWNLHAETVEKIVAIVNDEIITQQDIDNYKKQLQRGKFIDDLLMDDKATISKDRTALINHMIDERIIDSEVKREDLSVTLEKVDQEIRKIAEGNHMSKAQLAAEVKKEGISFADYQQFIKQRLERQALVQKAISSKIKITDDEIQNYYLNHYKGSSTTGYEYSVAHILFLPKGGDKEAAKKRAENVLAKLNKGESFETLASQFSEDPNYANGGFLGNFKSGEFLKELEAAVRPLGVGEHSDVVASKLGYHIVKLISKKITYDPAYEAKKKEIQNALYEKAFSQQFKFWIAQKRQESFIKINK
jgi:peptidyl-prolyl cis-trans isomerase SurA